MADFSVSDVASKIKAPEGISLSDMMSMSLNAQKFKQAQQVNPLLLRQQEALTTEAEETLEPKITKAKAESETADYGANTAHLKNILDATTNGIQQIQILQAKKDKKGNPIATPKDVEDMLTKTINSSNQFLTPEDKKAAIAQALQGLDPNASPTDVQVFLAQKHLSTLSTQADAEKRYPNAYMQDTGQEFKPLRGGNKLLTGQEPTLQVGPSVTKQLPTGTQRVITDPTEATRMGVPVGTTVFVGGGAGGQGVGGKPTPPAVSSMQPGQSESLRSRAESAASDWKQTQLDASFATKNISLLQLVKEYSNAAVTGSHAEGRQYLTKLAATFGLPGDWIQSATDTDLLNKVTNMLSQAGGNTDASKLIAQASNPNAHMTVDAVKKAANQLIGQEKLKLVKASVMQQFQTDPEKYSKALTQFSQIADPNVLQYSSMTEAEQKRFKSSMTESEQKSFEKKHHALDVLNKKYNLGLM
jgi:hypothetical protein